ncbi:hypothetical protein CHUAL_004873 [Chamberlinius hualienensis]
MFTFVLFVSCAAGILPTVNFLCDTILFHKANILLILFFDVLVNFIICFRTIISSARINSKRRFLISALMQNLASDGSIDIHLIDHSMKNMFWNLDLIKEDDDWFSMIWIIPINCDLFFTIIQSLLNYFDSTWKLTQ